MKLCLFQCLYYVIIGAGQNNVTWFPSGTANFFSGYVGRCGVWKAVPLNPFRVEQRKTQYHVEAILSLCWLPFNWINSTGKKDATDLCTYEGSGSCAVFIPADMEQFSPEHFQYLQWSLMLLRCFFLSKSSLVRWLIIWSFGSICPKHL